MEIGIDYSGLMCVFLSLFFTVFVIEAINFGLSRIEKLLFIVTLLSMC